VSNETLTGFDRFESPCVSYDWILTLTRSYHEDVQFRVLRILEQRPEISQRELAEEVGIALGKINYVMSALTEAGLVKIRNFRNSKNKLRYAYILTPAGLSAKAELTAGFLRRKIAEYESLKAEIEALQHETKPVSEPLESP
jgi:EPS-associated MarR family transcriptional regulator